MRRFAWFGALFLLLGIVFGAGYATGHQQAVSVDGQLDYRTLDQVTQLIKQRYPNAVADDKLELGATKGLVQGIGDPYSAYLSKDEAKELDNTLAGTVEGIGVEVGERDGRVTVIAPLPGSPATKAGVVAGDVILAVDDTVTANLQLDEVVKKIRGPKGTPVKIVFQTPGQQPRTITIVRETVTSPSVDVSYQGDVAILKVSRFGDDTKVAVRQAAEEIKSKNVRGVVLDLRDNPGGFLTSAVDLVSVFLRDGVVVKEKFAQERTDEERVSGQAILPDTPLVVLVNKGSASASEISAGALRDNGRAKLVGEQTFGKASVQELIKLHGDNVLKLTIAEWLTPNGTSISKQGLKPDVESPSTDPTAQLNAAIGQLGN